MRLFARVIVMVFVTALPAWCADQPETVAAKEAPDSGRSALSETTINPVLAIVGEWTIPGQDSLPPGSMSFSDDGTYSWAEYRESDMKVTLTGEYKIDTTATPPTIDLCLDKCNNPGAEWTTTFAIFRFLSVDRVEMRYSPDGKRPTAFDEKDVKNTRELTRKQ